MRPRVSVEPMYIPGRLRTASSPSRTRRCAALYVLSIVGLLQAGNPIVTSDTESTCDTPGNDEGTLRAEERV